jgi:ParB family chromosome partitioning protein
MPTPKVTSDYITCEVSLPIDRVKPNPQNPRHEAGDVTELAATIKQHGILQALLVKPDAQRDGCYIIEDGFRRYTAARAVGHNMLPCRVRVPEDAERFSDKEAIKHTLAIALVANLHGERLNAMERAVAYGRLRDEVGMNLVQIATLIGQSESNVSRILGLLELNDKSRDAVRSGKLTVTHALDAVTRTRQKARKQKGHKPLDVGWEPDHYTRHHALAKKAAGMCDAREHNLRRRLGRDSGFAGACGQCWETVIRLDQTVVLKAEFRAAGVHIPEDVAATVMPIFVADNGTSSK